MKERIHLKKMGSFFYVFFTGTDPVHVHQYTVYKKEGRHADVNKKVFKSTGEGYQRFS